MKLAAPSDLIGPCAGFRVLEFGTMVSGPLAGQNLGDLGADVIKLARGTIRLCYHPINVLCPAQTHEELATKHECRPY